jgi:hypothetical protein
MFILRDLLKPLQNVFPDTDNGRERFVWFAYTMVAILVPVTSARSSNLLRALQSLFGLSISQRRFYTFMASPKMPWQRIWHYLWDRIPQPFTENRLLLALDDSINPKTGKKIFACQHFFDHAAKDNQARYPWSQNIVTVGLLKSIRGRWCCLPLSFRFYFLKKTLAQTTVCMGAKEIAFRSKFDQAVEMITELAQAFKQHPILVVTDSWFGNNGLLKPLSGALGDRVHLLARLRCNAALYAQPDPRQGNNGPGRPRKYGARLGQVSEWIEHARQHARLCKVILYGKPRELMAYDRIVMLKSLRRQVRVVWVFRNTQWIALVTTDLDLSVEQIIEYYGARWKIEAGFKEIKQEIGSAKSQTRDPYAVTNHLHFCMAATTLTWIFADRMDHTPARRYATNTRTEYAFADVRRSIADTIAKQGFDIGCPKVTKPERKSLLSTFMRLVA